MTVTVENLGLRYDKEFVFKKLSYTFSAGNKYAILGPNGSGKSSLMKVLSGYVTPSKGAVHFTKNNQVLKEESIYRQVAYTAPYIDLIEEFTLLELLNFQSQFKSFGQQMDSSALLDVLQLKQHAHKFISDFSSGMKQRVKLGLSILSDSDFLLLDEPATNLDAEGVKWYQDLLNQHSDDRLVIIASNRPDEYEGASKFLQITDYK